MENTNTTTKIASFVASTKEKVSNVYHNETVRKTVKITAGVCAVVGVGYLAFKYFGSKAADVLPEVAGAAADVAAQTTEVVADVATSV